MLVLTRRLNEAILIGDVRVVVVRLGTACVALGIEAPADVEIVRPDAKKKTPRQRSDCRRAD